MYFLSLCIASQIVDANSVTEILTEYSRLWRQIGLKLGLNSTVLENFKRDGTDQRDRFEKTLNAWQRLAGSNATWGALELAITNANREDLGLKSLPKCKLCTYCKILCFTNANF